MAEFKISRFRYTWKGDWDTTAYIKDDVVRYSGSSWVCVRAHTGTVFVSDQEYTPEGETNAIPAWIKMADGYSWKSAWETDTLYDAGDIILYSGVLYLCVTSFTSATVFDDDLDNLAIYLSSDNWLSNWTTVTRYGVGDIVRYNGIVYRCNVGHASAETLDADIANWSIYNEGIQYRGEWSETVEIGSSAPSQYRKNDLVKYGGTVWRCIETHTVGADSTLNFESEEFWVVVLPGQQQSGTWNASTPYQIGDIVRHGGHVYYSLTVNYNSVPGESIYQSNDRVDPVDWAVLAKGIKLRGDWSATETYKTGDVVRRGGHIYIALTDTTDDGSSLDYLDSSNWELIVTGQAWKNTWAAGTPATETDEEVIIVYSPGDVVTFHGTAYICTLEHAASNENYPGDNGNGISYWDILLLSGDTNVGMTTRGDLLTYDLSRDLTGDGSSFKETNTPIGELDQLLVVDADGSASYKTWGTTEFLTYVAPHGVDDIEDPNRGFNYFKPWKTIRFACERIEESGLSLRGSVKIKVWAGVYEEVLPIIVPANTAIQGDEVRAITVKPKGPITELALDSTYTISVLTRLSTIMNGLLAGTEITKSLSNIEDQVIPEFDYSSATSDVEELISDITAYIDFYINDAGTAPVMSGKNKISSANIEAGKTYQILELGTTDFTAMNAITNTVGLVFTASIDGYGDGFVVETTRNRAGAVDTLRLNKEFLAAEAVAYMQTNFPIYEFDSESCKRDVRRYIDAITYDLTYSGNYKSLYAARYYRNAVLGSSGEDMFYVRDATGIRNMTLTGLIGTLGPLEAYETFQRPTGGAYVSLDPGWGPADDRTWIRTRSCYVQNCCTFGYAAVGQKIDGDLHAGGNKSIVSNDFTQIISDGIGAWVLNGGRAELVSVFTYYSQIGYLAEGGGIIRATNGNNSYGQIGAMAIGINNEEVPRTATINTRNNDAVIASAFAGEVNDEILILEFSNAGQNYTTANYSFIGSGINASVVADEFRDNAVYESLRINPSDSGVPGGGGYTFSENNAQEGNLTTIMLAAADANEESEYLGLRILIVSGPGTGQYGYIDAYNVVTKVVTVRKESTGELGWDHVIPAYPIVDTLLPATRYRIEPRAVFSEPPYSAAQVNTGITSNWGNVVYGETTTSYTNITGSAGTGTVTEDDGLTPLTASWNITKVGRTYSVALNAVGAGYEAGQTVVILGTSLGGATPENDITITVTDISNDSTNSITGFTYDGIGVSGKFVVTSTVDATIIHSADGDTWASAGIPSAGNWQAIAAGNNMFVTLKYGSASAASSLDGVTWTARTLPASRNWVAVTYGANRFVAIASNLNAAAYSLNGTSWTASTLPTAGDSSVNEWIDICYGKNKFVAIANSSNAFAYSSDGISWTGDIIDPAGTYEQHDWVSIAYGNNRFVAISSAGEVAYSFDLTTWYSATMPSQDGSTAHNWKKIRYAQGVFFAVGDTGSRDIGADPTVGATTFAATSPDGVLWTTRTLDTSASWASVGFGNPDVTLDDSSIGNNKGMWVAVPSETSLYINKIYTGATTKGRVVLQNGRVSSVRLWEPGSGYIDEAPTLTITDPNNTSDLVVENRLGDGVLANPSWINRGLGYRTSTTQVTITGDGFADIIPTGKFITLSDLEIIPKVGSQIIIQNHPQVYNAVRVTPIEIDGNDGLNAYIQISPVLDITDYAEHGLTVSIREKYSQCRITGHDFLDIGTGNFVETNYPELYATGLYTPQPFNEVLESDGGRVFYTSTDQSGNFRTGELFAVEQATGIVTISADFFDLSGLTELKLGGVRLGGSGVVIREFSTDPLFTEDSNNVIPTERAIKAYLNNKLSVSGADLVGAAFTAGQIKVGPIGITNVLDLKIQVPAVQGLNFAGAKANVSGHILAQSMFYRSFKDDGQ